MSVQCYTRTHRSCIWRVSPFDVGTHSATVSVHPTLQWKAANKTCGSYPASTCATRTASCLLFSAGQPRVKASQCFTKYKHRDEEAAAAANGPAIVATQVVSDYLTPYDGDAAFLRAGNRPVTTYTYRMAFTRASGGADLAARGGGGMSAGLASS
jgi:hypothetical protein